MRSRLQGSRARPQRARHARRSGHGSSWHPGVLYDSLPAAARPATARAIAAQAGRLAHRLKSSTILSSPSCSGICSGGSARGRESDPPRGERRAWARLGRQAAGSRGGQPTSTAGCWRQGAGAGGLAAGRLPTPLPSHPHPRPTIFPATPHLGLPPQQCLGLGDVGPPAGGVVRSVLHPDKLQGVVVCVACVAWLGGLEQSLAGAGLGGTEQARHAHWRAAAARPAARLSGGQAPPPPHTPHTYAPTDQSPLPPGTPHRATAPPPPPRVPPSPTSACGLTTFFTISASSTMVNSPGLPMLKGPMWSSLSMTRTMPVWCWRGVWCVLVWCVLEWCCAGVVFVGVMWAWQEGGEVAPGCQQAVATRATCRRRLAQQRRGPRPELAPPQPPTRAHTTSVANPAPPSASPSIRSDTYWKERVCLPSPNSVSGSFFRACLGARQAGRARQAWGGWCGAGCRRVMRPVVADMADHRCTSSSLALPRSPSGEWSLSHTQLCPGAGSRASSRRPPHLRHKVGHHASVV